MAAVQTRSERALNKVAIAAVLVITLIFLAPIYWITSTAFKPRNLSTTIPPTVLFEPEISPFVKLFTKRSQLREAPTPEEYAAAPWWERMVFDGGEKVVRSGRGEVQPSGYPNRFMNSLIVAITSTVLAVGMGTFTAYGFSRFKVKGEADLLFFILSTRMLPPVVVAIPMFLMYRVVGLNDTHWGLIILYTAFNLSFSVWLMKGFIDEIPKEYEEAALVDRLEASNGAQCRRLAAARLSEQHDELVVGDGEIEVLDDLDGAEIFLDAAKFDLRHEVMPSSCFSSRGILVVTMKAISPTSVIVSP